MATSTSSLSRIVFVSVIESLVSICAGESAFVSSVLVSLSPVESPPVFESSDVGEVPLPDESSVDVVPEAVVDSPVAWSPVDDPEKPSPEVDPLESSVVPEPESGTVVDRVEESDGWSSVDEPKEPSPEVDPCLLYTSPSPRD